QEMAWHPDLVFGGASFIPGLVASQNYFFSFVYWLFPFSAVDIYSLFYLQKLAIFVTFALGGLGYLALLRVVFRLSLFTSTTVGMLVVLSQGILFRHYEIDW